MNRNETTRHLHEISKDTVGLGNNIWTVVNDQLFCHMMTKVGDEWETKILTEDDYPPLSCPRTLLKKATIGVNPKWRDGLLSIKDDYQKMKEYLKSLIQRRCHDESIILILGAKENFKIPKLAGRLILEKVVGGIRGRAKNKRLYAVPIRMIKDIQFTQRGKEWEYERE